MSIDRVNQLSSTCVRRRFALAPALLVLGVTLLCGTRAMASSGGEVVTTAAEPGSLLEVVLFYAVATMTIVSSVAVCMSKNIVRMALWLFMTLASVSFLYFLLAANFLASIQLVVYAGGTLVLLVFGVMLTNKSPWARYTPGKLELVGAAAVCSVLLVALWLVFLRAEWSRLPGAFAGTSVADLGRSLLSVYVVPFEVAGVLLMIVMVGAAHLARQDK